MKVKSQKIASSRQERRKPAYRLKWLGRGFVVFFLFVLTACGIIRQTEILDQLLYYPNAELTFGPAPTDYKYEEVFFNSEPEVLLRGYFAHPDPQLLQGSNNGKPKGTVVHAHGNAGDIDIHLPITAFLVRSGYQVFVFDYRGYGASTGKISRAGTFRDTRAAIDYVISREDVNPENLFLFGQSMGGAVAIVAATERSDLKGIVIESTFTTYPGVFSQALRGIAYIAPFAPLASFLMKRGLDPIDYISGVSAPILFIHGEEDQIIPKAMMLALNDQAPEPKEFKSFKGMIHLRGDINLGSEYTATIISFFDSLSSNAAKWEEYSEEEDKLS